VKIPLTLCWPEFLQGGHSLPGGGAPDRLDVCGKTATNLVLFAVSTLLEGITLVAALCGRSTAAAAALTHGWTDVTASSEITYWRVWSVLDSGKESAKLKAWKKVEKLYVNDSAVRG